MTWRSSRLSRDSVSCTEVNSQDMYRNCGRTVTNLHAKKISGYMQVGNFLTSYAGHAMTQAVSRRPPSAEARFRSRISPCGICGGQSVTGTGFSLSISLHPCFITWKNGKKTSICCGVLHKKKITSSAASGFQRDILPLSYAYSYIQCVI